MCVYINIYIQNTQMFYNIHILLIYVYIYIYIYI